MPTATTGLRELGSDATRRPAGTSAIPDWNIPSDGHSIRAQEIFTMTLNLLRIRPFRKRALRA